MYPLEEKSNHNVQKNDNAHKMFLFKRGTIVPMYKCEFFKNTVQ